MPNQFELFTLLNLEAVTPATYSAFNTGCVAACTVLTCSCTFSYYYWSSSTFQLDPSSAWSVAFNGGDTSYDYKTNSHYVRAVRAGS